MVEAYNWYEPHHRYDVQHIDPYFLQIFDNNGRLLKASDNIAFFTSGAYPSRLLAYQTPADRMIQRLRLFTVDDKRLYYRTKPFHSESGKLLGYIQVARYDPGISSTMNRTAFFILGGIALLLMGLLGIIWWGAQRVVAPLEQITREANELSSTGLNLRINVPQDSDIETALLATTLNELLTRLERSFVEMQRFTADAAHELQTPLTIIKGHINVTLRRERTPVEYKKTLRVLLEQTEGLIHLVSNLLQLARLDADENDLTSEAVDLVSVVSRVVEQLNPLATEKNIEIKVVAPGETWIGGHVSFIQEIVSNLVENAVKYTACGQIRVEIQQKQEQVILLVRDTGMGMTENDLLHASDRFYRAPTSNVQGIPGSGLGLALVEQIVAKLKGTFSIESSPGNGTTVKISFFRLTNGTS